jgi:hypothetical protein
MACNDEKGLSSLDRVPAAEFDTPFAGIGPAAGKKGPVHARIRIVYTVNSLT